ncbi:hypothetical protein MBH78_07665 [Oceanimonas sp. NS1]|nr:hypothetical protein [Oceanimonas sp. NS1]
MLEGLEKALDGKSEGDSFSVTLAPADAYGERDESLIQRISVRHLQGAKRWEPGMVAMVHTESGPRQVVVVKVGRFMADVDLNHLLAGRTLTLIWTWYRYVPPPRKSWNTATPTAKAVTSTELVYGARAARPCSTNAMQACRLLMSEANRNTKAAVECWNSRGSFQPT